MPCYKAELRFNNATSTGSSDCSRDLTHPDSTAFEPFDDEGRPTIPRDEVSRQMLADMGIRIDALAYAFHGHDKSVLVLTAKNIEPAMDMQLDDHRTKVPIRLPSDHPALDEAYESDLVDGFILSAKSTRLYVHVARGVFWQSISMNGQSPSRHNITGYGGCFIMPYEMPETIINKLKSKISEGDSSISHLVDIPSLKPLDLRMKTVSIDGGKTYVNVEMKPHTPTWKGDEHARRRR